MVQTRSTPLEYAQAAVDTLRRTYPNPADLPPTQHFHYHQGVLLSGVHQTYLINNDESYLEYIRGWIESNLDDQGHVLNHDPVCLDDIQPGILLFPLYDHFGSPRYKTAWTSWPTTLKPIRRTTRADSGTTTEYRGRCGWMGSIWAAP